MATDSCVHEAVGLAPLSLSSVACPATDNHRLHRLHGRQGADRARSPAYGASWGAGCRRDNGRSFAGASPTRVFPSSTGLSRPVTLRSHFEPDVLSCETELLEAPRLGESIEHQHSAASASSYGGETRHRWGRVGVEHLHSRHRVIDDHYKLEGRLRVNDCVRDDLAGEQYCCLDAVVGEAAAREDAGDEVTGGGGTGRSALQARSRVHKPWSFPISLLRTTLARAICEESRLESSCALCAIPRCRSDPPEDPRAPRRAGSAAESQCCGGQLREPGADSAHRAPS